MSKDNALSFVGQIMTAYKAIMKAEGSALEHAIECGKYLSLAKENVEAAKPKRKWSAWLAEHCPGIHRNTAALYMRLAKNEEAIADCESIREADMKLRKSDDEDDDNDEAESDSDESQDDEADDDAQRVVQDDAGDEALRASVVRQLASQDLKCTLENVDVDEVCTALIDAWDEDHIRQLCDRLRDHFTKSDIPTPLRRPLPQPTLS
jgi:hypothetical protein